MDFFEELERGSEFHNATRASGGLMIDAAEDTPKCLQAFQLLVDAVRKQAVSRGYKFIAHKSALHSYGCDMAWLYFRR